MRTNHNAVYKLNLLVIRSHNSHDRFQIYHKSNSARNHTINEQTLAIMISFKNCNKVIEKMKTLKFYEGLFITLMTPLARFAHKYDKLNRKMKIHKSNQIKFFISINNDDNNRYSKRRLHAAFLLIADYLNPQTHCFCNLAIFGYFALFYVIS